MSTTQKALILLGAPLVVVAGLTVNWGVEKGSAVVEQVEGWAHELEHSADPVTMHVGNLPLVSTLHVDGVRLGKLDHVVVMRNRPGAVDSLRLVVRMDGDAATHRFDGCQFRIDLDAMDGTWPLEGLKHVLQCAGDTAGLVPFGEVIFVGADRQAQLFVVADDVACERLSDPDVAVCDDIRVKMRRLRDELREELRTEVQDHSIRIQIDR